MDFGISGIEQEALPIFAMGTAQRALPIAPSDITDPTVRTVGVHGGGIGFGDVVVVGIVAGLSIHGTAVVVAEPFWVVFVELADEAAEGAVLVAPVPQAVRTTARISNATSARGLCFTIRSLCRSTLKDLASL